MYFKTKHQKKKKVSEVLRKKNLTKVFKNKQILKLSQQITKLMKSIKQANSIVGIQIQQKFIKIR